MTAQASRSSHRLGLRRIALVVGLLRQGPEALDESPVPGLVAARSRQQGPQPAAPGVRRARIPARSEPPPVGLPCVRLPRCRRPSRATTGPRPAPWWSGPRKIISPQSNCLSSTVVASEMAPSRSPDRARSRATSISGIRRNDMVSCWSWNICLRLGQTFESGSPQNRCAATPSTGSATRRRVRRCCPSVGRSPELAAVCAVSCALISTAPFCTAA